MKKILVADLLNEITRYLLGGDSFYRISITDSQCLNKGIQILVNKEEGYFETSVISDLTAEDKYTELYDKLVTTYVGRTQLVTGHSFGGEYLAYLIIDEKVMVLFNYITREGHQWLCELWCKN